MQPSNTILYTDASGGTVFLTESSAIGMEHKGRLSTHSIEQWIAYSWNDMPKSPIGSVRALPTEASLTCGLGDQSISFRGHPYER